MVITKQICLILCKILGTYSLASLTPVIFNTTEAVLDHFTPSERGCYVDKEFNLKILQIEAGYRYSIKNCLYSSAIEQIMENCSCVPNVVDNTTEYFQLLPCRHEQKYFLFRI